LCPFRVRDDQRVIGVAAVRDVGKLRMHVVGGIGGTLLGNLALARDFTHELQPGLKLLWRQILELLFEFESAAIGRPHIVEHHLQLGDAGLRDFGLPSCRSLVRGALLANARARGCRYERIWRLPSRVPLGACRVSKKLL